WIPVLGIMLAGIVAMQVEVLKLNAGIGRSMQQTTQLNARNEVLRASVAQLSDDQRIESVAARMGMIMPAPSAVGFLSARASGVTNRVRDAGRHEQRAVVVAQGQRAAIPRTADLDRRIGYLFLVFLGLLSLGLLRATWLGAINAPTLKRAAATQQVAQVVSP